MIVVEGKRSGKSPNSNAGTGVGGLGGALGGLFGSFSALFGAFFGLAGAIGPAITATGSALVPITATGIGSGIPFSIYVPFKDGPGGSDREYFVTEPFQNASAIVLNLHATGEHCRTRHHESGVLGVVNISNFLLVTPCGRPDTDGRPTWVAGACCKNDKSQDDEDSVLAPLEALKDRYLPDSPVYAVGFGAGGNATVACSHTSYSARIISKKDNAAAYRLALMRGDDGYPGTFYEDSFSSVMPDREKDVGAWVARLGCAKSPSVTKSPSVRYSQGMSIARMVCQKEWVKVQEIIFNTANAMTLGESVWKGDVARYAIGFFFTETDWPATTNTERSYHTHDPGVRPEAMVLNFHNIGEKCEDSHNTRGAALMVHAEEFRFTFITPCAEPSVDDFSLVSNIVATTRQQLDNYSLPVYAIGYEIKVLGGLQRYEGDVSVGITYTALSAFFFPRDRAPVDHDGVQFTYDGASGAKISSPLMVIIDFHSFNQNSSGCTTWLHHLGPLYSLADRYKNVLISPSALASKDDDFHGSWNAGSCCNGDPSIDGFAFAREVIQLARRKYGSSIPIFAWGREDGAMMAQGLLCAGEVNEFVSIDGVLALNTLKGTYQPHVNVCLGSRLEGAVMG
ncbi:hypothetical protein FOL47_010872 [Perkinsus chesapeaki]|uniref:Uncharacterized protein n=1 Tax=Perkinsus chesapeaki TaxID=330153 RepID=A0A7J6MNT2_PERCH|nr:hypothetical protein FOL47_010872 [Perkinsus chesapeaki]